MPSARERGLSSESESVKRTEREEESLSLISFFIHITYSQATEQSKRKWLQCSRRVDVARMISSYTESPSPSLAQSQPFTQSSIVSFTSCSAAVAVYTVMH